MLQVSLVGYFVTGLFLDVAYFDLLYVLIGLVVATSSVVSRQLIADADQATNDLAFVSRIRVDARTES